jgi:hypothetical protein
MEKGMQRNSRPWALMAIALIVVSFGECRADDVDEIARLVKDLDSREYQVRVEATRALERFGARAIPFLANAISDGSLEQRTRALAIVGDIYRRGDRESFYAAEQILDAAAKSGKGSLAKSARGILEATYHLRQRLAIAEIERMGGRVLLVQSAIPLDPEDPSVADALSALPNDDAVVVGIMIDRTWSGGEEGLRHVRRLTRLLYLYRDKKTPIGDEAWNELQADMPQLSQQLRGPAYLGIKPLDVRPFNGESGCQIREVTPGSAAAKAGMMPQDVVTEFDDQPVRDFESLIELIADKLPGDTVPITVVRNGEPVKLEAELTAWPKLNFTP